MALEGNGQQNPPSAGTDVDRGKREPGPSSPLSLLSRQEGAVVRLLGAGFSRKEIGTRLGLSPQTIETYLRRAANKLGLLTRRDLVRFAIGSNLPSD